MIELLQSGVHNALWFLLAIAIMVAFHEFGHFWVARRFGIKVLRFSVGFSFGPFKPLWQGRGRDGVEYQIGSIPLGGYVKLLDEREGPVAEAERHRAFNRQPVWVRIAVFAAGPLFNMVLAVVFFWLMLMVGVPDRKPIAGAPPAGSVAAVAGLHEGDLVLRLNDTPLQTWGELNTGLIMSVLTRRPVTLTVQDHAGAQRQLPLALDKVRTDPQYLTDDLGFEPYQPPIAPVLGEVLPGSPAEKGGLQQGDTLLSLDGKPVDRFQQLQPVIAGHGGQLVSVEVQRGTQRLSLSVIPGQMNVDGHSYVGIGVRAPHIAADDKMWQDLRIKQQYGPLAALPVALQLTWDTGVMVVEFVYHMVLGDISAKNISGPINTAQVVGVSASIGLWALLHVVAIVSLNLGIVNLLPVPLLDGGQILFGLVEWIKGSPLSERAQAYGQQVGLTLLVLLMGLAFYNDLSRLIG
jgi:regulator of sigma E protease